MQTFESPTTQTPKGPQSPTEPVTDSRGRGRRWALWPIIAAVVFALAGGAAIWVLVNSGDDNAGRTETASSPAETPTGADIATSPAETATGVGTQLAATEEPSDFAVDIAERWGRAWESGDNDAVRALYTSELESANIVDRLYRAVWTDVDKAIDMINWMNSFERFELVRVEEFIPYHPQRPPSGFIVAEYDVYFTPEEPGGDSGQPSTVVVVFIGFADGLIEQSDIYFDAWPSFFTSQVGYPQRETEEGWVIIN